ncbi:helix-turn-helix domain-containing protein [uncultured Friedmanniella sp.]|uniref:helix-turn-helix domain-containing protein n=1 Tax=uncultured Friedmanniella sp. TaxID=335381 RepID=UPI0035CB010F
MRAALELSTERGFGTVTTAELAGRAGVTERTRFRHFPDKREVLFDVEQRLTESVDAAFAELPDAVPARRRWSRSPATPRG